MRFSRVVAALAFTWACHSDRQVDPKPDGAELVRVVAHDVSPPLRELAKLPRPQRDIDEVEEAEPARRIPHPTWRSPAQLPAHDTIEQRAYAAPDAIAATTVNFEAMGAGMSGFTPGGIPPDTDGDIGPNHYVQVVNVSMSVFSRSGSTLMGPMDTGMVWSGFNGNCGQSNDGDATVRYDHLADRWVISQFSLPNQAPYYQCVAVSTSPDPTGTYTRYQFSYDAMNDYPKIALWPDAYYFTFNMFPDAGGFAGGKVCAMDRTKMLAGDATATMQCFDAGSNYGGLLVSDLDGKTLPPSGAPAHVVTLDTDSTLAFWQLHVDWATPSNSTFTGPTSIPITTFSALCGGNTCVDEPTGGVQLDSLADRPMNRFAYRRFADHESMVFSHSVTAGSGGGVRWYELRDGTNPTVYQQGTFAPDGAFRWLPSAAMDAAGDIAAVYTISSSTIDPGIRYTAHASTDPLGTMGQGEGTIVAGAGYQTQVSRWGDYASINIDPVDDCTFWATHQYYKTAGRSSWQTRVAAFSLPNCSAFALTANDETVAQGASATYPVDTSSLAGTPQSVQLTATNLPQGVTATFSPASVTAGQTAMVTLTADASAVVGPTHYSIAGMGSTSSAMVDVALTVTAEQSGGGDAGTGGDGGHKPGGCCDAGGAPGGAVLLGFAVAMVIGRRRRS